MPRVLVPECESCGQKQGERHKATEPMPSMETLENIVFDLENCTATDGCTVESDGHCSHGHQSWLLRMGMIL